MIKIKATQKQGGVVGLVEVAKIADREQLALEMITIQFKLREAVREIVPEERQKDWIAILNDALQNGPKKEETEK